MSDFLDIRAGDAPLVIALPHTGTDIPTEMEGGFVSPWLARKDADWWVDRLYAFAGGMGVTTIRTRISRSVVDVNRDPSGRSLYPGQATTDLCPTTTFDGEPLYCSGKEPDAAQIARRRAAWFDPYHATLEAQITRLRTRHERVVLYDAHSIRSHVPRLFEGELPQFNIGTNGDTSCDPKLTRRIAEVCCYTGSPWSGVVNGRFKGGWTTRHYGRPREGVHAIQMELAQRTYMAEPDALTSETWPTPMDGAPAILPVLRQIISAALQFAKGAP